MARKKGAWGAALRKGAASAPAPKAGGSDYGFPHVIERASFQDGRGWRLYVRLENHRRKGWWRVFMAWGPNPNSARTREGQGTFYVVKSGEATSTGAPNAEARARNAYRRALDEAREAGWRDFQPNRGGSQQFKMLEAVPPAGGAKAVAR